MRNKSDLVLVGYRTDVRDDWLDHAHNFDCDTDELDPVSTVRAEELMANFPFVGQIGYAYLAHINPLLRESPEFAAIRVDRRRPDLLGGQINEALCGWFSAAAGATVVGFRPDVLVNMAAAEANEMNAAGRCHERWRNLSCADIRSYFLPKDFDRIPISLLLQRLALPRPDAQSEEERHDYSFDYAPGLDCARDVRLTAMLLMVAQVFPDLSGQLAQVVAGLGSEAAA